MKNTFFTQAFVGSPDLDFQKLVNAVPKKETTQKKYNYGFSKAIVELCLAEQDVNFEDHEKEKIINAVSFILLMEQNTFEKVRREWREKKMNSPKKLLSSQIKI